MSTTSTIPEIGSVAPSSAAERSPVTRPGPAATRLELPLSLRAEIASWVVSGYPAETCGLLVGRVEGPQIEVLRVFEGRNLDQERSGDRYQLDPQDFLRVDQAARQEGLEIVGIWHSHPDCPARPSTTDLATAWDGYSYLIVGVTGDGGTDFHSWRLDGSPQDARFSEEKILPEGGSEPPPALRFENPLKEERSS